MTSGDAPAPIKYSAVRGVGWTSFIQTYRISMGILTTWILAIWLGEEEFGLVGGAAILVGFLMLLKDLGTGSAIIQREDLGPRVLSSIFWTNVLLGVAGTTALFSVAPLVGWFFGEPELVPVMHALSFMVLLAGLGTTHQSLLQRELRFARLAKIETLAITAGGIAGITGAVCGAGVWALVLQSLATMGLTTMLAVGLHSWRPSFVWNLADVRSVAKFSLNLTGFNVLNYITRSSDQLLILWVLGKGEAGLYFLAIKMLLFPLSTINSVLSRVLFPLFATIQDDNDRLRNAFLKVTGTIAMLVLPFVVGFAIVADSIIGSCLPAKWLPVVPLAVALSVVAMMQSLSTSVGNIYMAKARTDLMLLWGVIACVFGVASFAVGVQFGSVGVARAYAVFSLLFFWPAVAIPLRLIDTPMRMFFGAIYRPLLAAVGMGAFVAYAGVLIGDSVGPGVDLLIRVPLGAVLYVGLSLLLNGDHVRQVFMLLRTHREDRPSNHPTNHPTNTEVTVC